MNTLNALKEYEAAPGGDTPMELIEQEFHVLRRLTASKFGYKSFTSIPRFREIIGKKVLKALNYCHSGLTYAVIEYLNSLMQPMHYDTDLKQEQLNKASLLSSKSFLDGLIDILITNVIKGTGALVVASLLDFLSFALCPPFSETTDGEHFDSLLDKVAENGRIFYKLYQHSSMTIVKGASMIMKAIIEEGTPDLALRMQELSLAEGALLHHFHVALYASTSEPRMLTIRQLSRHLVALWCTGNEQAKALLERIIPVGLLQHLDSSEKAPREKDLINTRDNLSLAIEHDNEANKSTKAQIISHGRRMQRKLLNTDRVRVIEKQLNSALQHWKQRIASIDTETKTDVYMFIFLLIKNRSQKIF